MKQSDVEWFRPLWLRVVVTGGLAIWCGLEWFAGDPFWGVLTGLGLAYSLYNFFIAFPKDQAKPAEPAVAPPSDEEQP